MDADKSIKIFLQLSRWSLKVVWTTMWAAYDYRATSNWRDNMEIVSTHYINLTNMSPKSR